MSHWRIEGVPCCLSPWTGSKMSALDLSLSKTTFKCSCSRKEFESMSAALSDLFPEERLTFSYHEDSCPGDMFWDTVRFSRRVEAINDWLKDKGLCGGWSVDERLSTNELFVVSSSYDSLYVVDLPGQGWSFVSKIKLTNDKLDPPNLYEIEER